MSHCPFSVTDHSPSVAIEDTGFFNGLGLLGAFSLLPHQAVVLYTDLPVKDLGVNYWSYVLYLADSYDPNKECSPYKQTHIASLSPAFNMFTAVGVSGKRFNPLTAETGTIVKGHVSFYMILALDPHLAQRVREKILSDPPYPFDLIYIMKVPAGPGSQKLDPLLPNPNHLTTKDPAYSPSTQRLCCFLRLNPSPQATELQKKNLQQFIQGESPFEDHFDVVLLDAQDLRSSSSLFHYYSLPKMLPPMYDEKQKMSTRFSRLCSELRSILRKNRFSVLDLRTRNSTLNIFGPLFKNVLRTTHPYRGGYQAVQLGGNGQGDNYDAQYRLSESACLTDEDVLIAVCVNHAKLGNAMYNSMNVVDVNKAFGYQGVQMDHRSGFEFYLVLVGRNQSLLNVIEGYLYRATAFKFKIHKIWVTTGPSSQGHVPLCHSLLMVERTYLNPRYSSVKEPSRSYQLQDLFGSNYQELLPAPDQDAWDSLINVVAPDNSILIPPVYLKASQFHVLGQFVFLTVAVVLISVMTIFIYAWTRFFKKRKK